jgi:hypothetical protein
MCSIIIRDDISYSRPVDAVLKVNAFYWSIINIFKDTNIKTEMKLELKNYVWCQPWRSLLQDEIRSVRDYDYWVISVHVEMVAFALKFSVVWIASSHRSDVKKFHNVGLMPVGQRSS